MGYKLLGPCNGKIVVEGFRKNISNEAEEITSLDMGAKNQYSSIHFLAEFIDSLVYLKFL